MEEWKDIKGYEGIYQVSNKGRVKFLGSEHFNVERIIKGTLQRNGYKTVDLWKNKQPIRKTIHRLVAEAFIPNPESKPTVNHKNHIRTDNTVENLEWATYSEQMDELWKKNVSEKRFKFPVGRYTKNIELVSIYESARAAEKDGFDHTKILRVCRGEKKYKTHKGFIWKFIE